MIANDFKSYSWYPGFDAGAAGVIYTLITADQAGFDLGDLSDLLYTNYNAARNYYTDNTNQASAGIYSGAAGFCLVMAMMIKDGLLEKNIQNYNLIAQLLKLETASLTISEGIAGQGLARMKCADLLAFPDFTNRISAIAARIIKSQCRDGSWKGTEKDLGNGQVKLTGLFHGISGITYFLIAYASRYNNENAKRSALKALSWLLRQRKPVAGRYNWPVNASSTAVEPWLEHGFSGVAFLFIKAYEFYRHSIYREAAYAALASHPPALTSNYISQASGISGLGEVYLEAYRVFGDVQWMERADHLACFLSHTYTSPEKDLVYWLDGSDTKPLPGFMSGNSGVIHFLLRHQNPERINFPLLSITH